MEFATEMIAKASLLKLKIIEIPTTLRKSPVESTPHLKPLRDGLRHLHLIFSYGALKTSKNFINTLSGLSGIAYLLLLFFAPIKMKCMHRDCFEMCVDCHKQSFGTEFEPIDCETCPSCKKEQTITCPICQEDKKKNELIHGDNCSHSVCCKCFCMSFNSHPMIECPLCRAAFKKTLHHR